MMAEKKKKKIRFKISEKKAKCHLAWFLLIFISFFYGERFTLWAKCRRDGQLNPIGCRSFLVISYHWGFGRCRSVVEPVRSLCTSCLSYSSNSSPAMLFSLLFYPQNLCFELLLSRIFSRQSIQTWKCGLPKG